MTLQANNAYGEALVELHHEAGRGRGGPARAAAAEAEQAKTRKQLGQLAGDLYRNGGLNPALSSFVSGTGDALDRGRNAAGPHGRPQRGPSQPQKPRPRPRNR